MSSKILRIFAIPTQGRINSMSQSKIVKCILLLFVTVAAGCNSTQQATNGVIAGSKSTSNIVSADSIKNTEDAKINAPYIKDDGIVTKPVVLDVHDVSISDRLLLPSDSYLRPKSNNTDVYSFVAQNLEIREALKIFSRAYKLNIISDNDVNGLVSVEFHDLPLEQAMSAILDSLGLHWEQEKNLIKVKRWYTRSYTVDYLRLVRSGQGSSSANVSSSISSSGGEGGGEGEGGGGDGTFELTQKDSVTFWDELTEQLESMVSADGRIVINRMSGTVQITDSFERVSQVESYIYDITRAIHRQVEIDVRIVEVELNEDFSLGVDWTLISSGGSDKTNGALGLSNIITQPLGGFGAILPSVSLNLFESDNRINFDTMISALNEQGSVNVVSKPKIRTMNNQPAMIKVGTDRTFFIRSVTTDTSAAGSTNLIEDTPTVVTEGIVMALTPQISDTGWIMMDISPVITRVASVERVVDGDGNVTSSSPNLDIRQTSSLVRMRNGNTIAIGGLIQTTESETDRGIPGLENVPLIGKLFRGDYDVKRKKELLIFLTANLVDTTPDEFANKKR